MREDVAVARAVYQQTQQYTEDRREGVGNSQVAISAPSDLVICGLGWPDGVQGWPVEIQEWLQVQGMARRGKAGSRRYSDDLLFCLQ